MSRFETVLALQLEVDYSTYRGEKPYFDKSFGNYLPGDYAEITRLKVLLSLPRALVEAALANSDPNNSMIELDIKNVLEPHQVKTIEEECWEHDAEEGS